MTVHIEFKKFEQPAQIRVDPARIEVHSRDNASASPTSGWVTTVAARTALAHKEMMVIFNKAVADVKVAQSNDATPLRFHIIPSGAQRAIAYDPTLPVKLAIL